LRLAAPVVRRLIERMPEGPSEQVRANAKASVSATATGGSRTASVTVDVNDVYAFTALSLVEFALRVEGKGPMSPAESVDPAAMLDALSGPLLTWHH
jgi:short subunit dehydrogenase-like uncharacterized protein